MSPLTALFFFLLVFSMLSLPHSALAESTVPEYHLKTRIVPEKASLAVIGEVIVPGASRNREYLYFQLAEQMRELKVDTINSRGMVNPVTLSKIGNEDGTDFWAAKLPETLTKGSSVTLRFSYVGGDRTAFVFHIGTDGSYGGGTNTAWYPQFGEREEKEGKVQIPSTGNGVGKLEFTVPKGLVVLASGKLHGTKSEGEEDMVSFDVSQPTAFAFVANHFHVRRRTGHFPISVYLLKEDSNSEEFVNGIYETVTTLEKIYGAFPFPEFAVAEVTDASTEGAGFGGVGFGGFMLATTSFLKSGFNRAFFGHEIGHQWWGNQITVSGERGESFLSEALAQYGSLVCVNTHESASMATRYRRDGYPGYIDTQCGNGYLNLHATGFDEPLGGATKNGLLAHELADNKGFLIWSQLADEIGEDKLHAAFRDITQKDAFQDVTLEIVLATIEKHAGRKLGWFWEQWLGRTGAPVLEAEWQQTAGLLKVTLHQKEPYYRLRVPLRICFADGSAQMVTVPTDKKETLKTLSVKQPVVSIDIDPEFRILHYSLQSLARAMALKEITTARFQLQQGKATEAMATYEKVVASSDTPDVYGVEFEIHLAKARKALVVSKEPAITRTEIERALRCVFRPPFRMVRAYSLLLQAAIQLKDMKVGRWAAQSLIAQEKILGQHTGESKDAEAYLEANPLWMGGVRGE